MTTGFSATPKPSVIGDYVRPDARFSRIGGACGVGSCINFMQHKKRRCVDRLVPHRP